MGYEIKIGNHPAQARHWKTGEPLFDNDGKPVPLLPDFRGVYLDGFCVAYVSDSMNIAFTVPINKLTQTVADDIVAHVKAVFGTVKHVAAPKDRPEPDAEPDDGENTDPYFDDED